MRTRFACPALLLVLLALPLVARRIFMVTLPAAVIQSGTMLTQRTVVGTLATIADRAQEAGIKPPAVLVVGGVVELAESLRWWENRPL